MKKLIYLIIILSLFLIPLASCSSNTKSNSNYDGSGDSYNSNNQLVDSSGRKVIYHVSYSYTIKDENTTVIKDVKTKVQELEGYVSYTSTSQNYTTYRYSIPTESLNTFLDYIDSIENMGNKYLYSYDVTSDYDSLATKIANLEARKKIYQDEIDTNTELTAQEKLAYNTQIDEINEKLDEYYVEYNSIKNSTAYSTVTISYNKDNSKQWFEEFGTVMLYTISFIGFIIAIASPFIVAGLIVFIILRKKNKKEKIIEE